MSEEAEALKRMHKQASLNIRQAPKIATAFRRRGINIGMLGHSQNDPLELYKPGAPQFSTKAFEGPKHQYPQP